MKRFFAVFLYMLSCQTHAAWKDEVVQDNLNYELNYNSSVTVQGNPHIFYGGGYLYHSYLDAGVWKQEKVDKKVYFDRDWYGKGVTAAADKNNNIHLIYSSSKVGNVKYATGRAGDWKIYETPLKDGGDSSIGDMAIDSNGKVHLVHWVYAGEPGAVESFFEHAVYDGNIWVRERLDNTVSPSCTFEGCKISLEIDVNDNLHVVYGSVSSNKYLKYQFYSNGSWNSSVIIDNSSGYINFESADILLQGSNPMVCYAYDPVGSATTQYYCASLVNNSWVSSPVEITDDSGFDCFIPMMMKKVQSGVFYGVRHCSDQVSTYLQRIEFSGGQWVAQESVQYHPPGNSIYQMEYTGSDIFIFGEEWLDGTPFGLHNISLAAFKLGLTPSMEIISNKRPNTGGRFPNLMFGQSDTMHITYTGTDFSSGLEFYATRSTTGEWIPTEINNNNGTQNVVKRPIAITNDSHVSFFYSTPNSSSLSSKHVTLNNGVISTIDSFLSTEFKTDATAPAVLVDASGFYHIAYLDVETWSVNYATNMTGVWVIKSIYNIEYTNTEKDVFLGKVTNDGLSYSLDIGMNDSGAIKISFIEWHYDHLSQISVSGSLMSLTNETGSWISTFVAKNPDSALWENPVVKIDKNLSLHLVYSTKECSGTCFPAGIRYGTNKSGEWLEEKISVESFYYDGPETGTDDAYWITGLVADLSVNDNNDILISYIYGTPNLSGSNTSDRTSELRVTKVDSCMPVSRTLLNDFLVTPFKPVNKFIDTAINNQGVSAVAYFDETLLEPHVLIENKDLDVKSCVLSDNAFKVEVQNNSNAGVLLKQVLPSAYVDNVYSIKQNACQGVFLASGASCFIEINVNLATQIDSFFNVDSTFYMDILVEKENLQGLPTNENISFVIETDVLRPSMDQSGVESGGGSGGGSINPYMLIWMFVYLAFIRRVDPISRYRSVIKPQA